MKLDKIIIIMLNTSPTDCHLSGAVWVPPSCAGSHGHVSIAGFHGPILAGKTSSYYNIIIIKSGLVTLSPCRTLQKAI